MSYRIPDGDEMSVEEALKELREMGFARIRLEYVQIFDSDFPYCKRVEISIWRKQQGGKALYAPSIDEAMTQVRAWHKEQS